MEDEKKFEEIFVMWTDEQGKIPAGHKEGILATCLDFLMGTPEGCWLSEEIEITTSPDRLIFGDPATSLVYSLKADRLFEIEPFDYWDRVLLRTEPVEKKELSILGSKVERVTAETPIYGNLWRTHKIRVVRELDIVSFLRSLANHPDFWVRKAVAENPHTELEILKELSSDKNDWVLAGAASNPNIDKETLEKLCCCPDFLVRARAIRRVSFPLNTLREMAAKETEALPKQVIMNKIKTYEDTPILTKIKLTLSGW